MLNLKAEFYLIQLKSDPTSITIKNKVEKIMSKLEESKKSMTNTVGEKGTQMQKQLYDKGNELYSILGEFMNELNNINNMPRDEKKKMVEKMVANARQNMDKQIKGMREMFTEGMSIAINPQQRREAATKMANSARQMANNAARKASIEARKRFSSFTNGMNKRLSNRKGKANSKGGTKKNSYKKKRRNGSRKLQQRRRKNNTRRKN